MWFETTHSKVQSVRTREQNILRVIVAKDSLVIQFTPSREQHAEIMTKKTPIPTQRFLQFRSKLTVLTRPMGLKGILRATINVITSIN